MCFDPDSRPPIDCGTLAVDTETFRLGIGGGKSMAACFAVPSGIHAWGAGVVLLPDNRGVTPFYERLTECLASEGFPVLAIDYFAREEGPSGMGGSSADMRAVIQRVADLTRDGCLEQMTAAVQFLRERSGVRKVMALGFCMGGRIAFLAARPEFGLTGVIGLYGSTEAILDAPGPTQVANRMSGPVLGIFGGADASISAAAVAGFGEALQAAGVGHEIVVYPEAPHSFFDVAYAEHREICADTWRRMLEFLRSGQLTS